MKKCTVKAFVLILSFAAFGQLHAQNYQVSFAVLGGAQTPDSVEVTNLDQGTSLTLNGNDILHLLANPVGMNNHTIKPQNLKVYPNPMLSDGIVDFYNNSAGKVSIKICDITGKLVALHSDDFQQGAISYRISGLGKGTFFVHLQSQNNEPESAVIISQMETKGIATIELENTPAAAHTSSYKSTEKLIQMQYNDGETLKFTAFQNEQSAIQKMIITESQTVHFAFVETVTDIEGNVYPTISIGAQVWMASNLKTTKYNDGNAIPNIEGNSQWENLTTPAYCWWNNDQQYADTNNLGALYNWFTVETGNLCPVGWHVPTNAEFEELVFYMAENGYNYDGSIYTGNDIDEAGSKIGKSLAVPSGWLAPTYGLEWSIGKDQHLNNSSGFNGIGADGRYLYGGVFFDPGYLCNWWTSTPFDADYSWTFFMYTEEAALFKTWYFKEGGYSVRCIKDE